MTRSPALDAAALRREFDRSFAEPLGGERESSVELVALRAGSGRYALPLPDAAGLAVGLTLSALPSRSPAFAGLVHHRGALVPVFALGRLLGDADAPCCRCFLFLAAAEPVALGFDEYEGLCRVPRVAAEPASGLVRGVIQHAGTARAVLDARSILSAIQRSGGARHEVNER